jgi:hypothetical protein
MEIKTPEEKCSPRNRAANAVLTTNNSQMSQERVTDASYIGQTLGNLQNYVQTGTQV